MKRDLTFYLAAYKSETCQCGKAKRTRRSFCPHCYYALPHALQFGLYKRFCAGYEQAYEKALEHLDPDQDQKGD